MSLEWLVLTHADSDHYNIVRNFLTTLEVNVRNVLYGGLPGDYADKLIPWLENRNPDKAKTVVQTATNRNFFPLDTKQNLGAEVMVVACGVEAVRAQCRGLWVFDRLWVVPVFDYCG